MLGLFFGIVIVLMLLLLVLVVSREHQKMVHAERQSLSYPDTIPGPPEKHIVNGVDTSMLMKDNDDRDSIIDTTMVNHDDYLSSIDMNNLSKGTSSGMTGYVGFESVSAKLFADKDA